MEDLQKWLSWEGNFLKVTYRPDGVSVLDTKPRWVIELSAPLGSYKGSVADTFNEAMEYLNLELAKRNKSK